MPSLLGPLLAALLMGTAASPPAGSAPTMPERAASPAPVTRTPEGVLASMTLPQRIGELLMVGTATDRASTDTLRAIGRYHVGSVILMGHSSGGSRGVARTVAALQRQATPAATAGTRLVVAVDQEGGAIQHLQGTGFSTMPAALDQGTWSPAALQAKARAWGGELRRARVNLDLAPVADTVPRSNAQANMPIGHWRREYGHDPRTVARHATAFVRGMRSAHVATSAKHFPGLGRVKGNTDLVADVTDATTTRHDAYLRPFAATVRAGVPYVMMSLATYRRIDPRQPAAFSPTVVRGMLRGDLGFDGVVISDSLTAVAARRYPAGERAVRFVRAGGDVALVTDAGPVRAMYAALLATARRDPEFRARVDDAALHVLRAKQAYGLL